ATSRMACTCGSPSTTRAVFGEAGPISGENAVFMAGCYRRYRRAVHTRHCKFCQMSVRAAKRTSICVGLYLGRAHHYLSLVEPGMLASEAGVPLIKLGHSNHV